MSESAAILNAISLTVTDMAKSLAFYRRLGLTIPDDAVWSVNGAAHHVAITMPNGLTFELDSAAMTRSYFPTWSSGAGGITLILSLSTRQAVDELYTAMTAAGHAGHVAPFDAFWGARYAIIDDPDGNHVGIMSPMEEQHQSAPPQL